MARQYGEPIRLAVWRCLSVLNGGEDYDIGRYQIKQERTKYNKLK
jgi:hypothetical protein